MNIGSELEFENATVPVDSGDAFTLVARSPGVWGNKISVAIANEDDFVLQETEAFPGINLNNLFEFPATEDEIGIIVRDGDDIKEVYLVSINKDSKDINNKSNYIENVINRKSNLIFVKHLDGVKPVSCLVDDVIYLDSGAETTPTAGDIANAYDLWENKEEVDIDIVICNEVDGGAAGFNLADSRKDCIAFMGTEFNIVGQKAALANAEVLSNRSTFGKNSMFACYGGNYKYQYDRYNDKNRWINVAGDIAGLRAATSSSRASWWASAGLERGQLKNVIKLAFNPNQQQRDALYKKNINPIVTFPGQGTVMWG